MLSSTLLKTAFNKIVFEMRMFFMLLMTGFLSFFLNRVEAQGKISLSHESSSIR